MPFKLAYSTPIYNLYYSTGVTQLLSIYNLYYSTGVGRMASVNGEILYNVESLINTINDSENCFELELSELSIVDGQIIVQADVASMSL